MKAALRKNKILSALLLLGLLCALLLCAVRMGRELPNRRVCVVMSGGDLSQLDGVPEGVRGFEGGASLDGIPLLIEDERQYSNVGEFAAGAAERREAMARCFYLYPQYAARYAVMGYSGAEEIENILYRAVTDRSIRVLWLTPFTHEGKIITDPAVYEGVVNNLGKRLARRGLILGDEFSSVDYYEPGALPLLLTSFGMVSAGALLLSSFFPLSRKWTLALPGAGLLGCLGLLFLTNMTGRSLFVPVTALASAVIFPCLAARYAVERLAALREGGLARDLSSYAGILLGSAGIAALGALTVAALQSSSQYLLTIYNFRGVKLSQFLPVLFTVYMVLKHLCPPRELLKGGKFLLALVVLCVLGAVTLFLLRTGDGSVAVTTLEQRFRNLLELLLPVRPRTKEFLIAWPCLALSAALMYKGRRRYAWPFAVLSSVGFASLVNTFCHSRAPLLLSVSRTLIGLLLGCCLGIVILCLAHRRAPARE